jgi:hypothetical protein
MVIEMFKPSPTVAELGDFGGKNLRYSLLHWGMFSLTDEEWCQHCRMWADWDIMMNPQSHDIGFG